MEGFFCQFADKCQYAHGKHELRSKPTLKPEEISDDMKQRLIDKAQSRPDYKTKLCKNFEEKGACDFSDICHFAHGSGELREPPPGSESGAGTPGSNSIHFKTSMCKFADACQHGSACKFAHNESELRPSPHPAGGVVIPSTSAQGGGVLKTIMCKNYLATQQCQYGDRCNFAHSRSELNSSTIPGKTHPHQFQHPLIASASATMAISNQNSKYKTSLCNNWKNLGLCEKGSFCVYAHGMSDLRKTASTLGAVASPSVLSAETNSRFKTSLCLSYVSTGYCERGPGCAFAHGQHELRNLGTYKTVMCKNNSGGAVCPKGITCHYAHSMAELRTKVSAIPQLPQPLPMKRKQPVLKTALCQNFTKYGECTYGDNCNFAHGEVELQGSKRQRY